MQRIPGFETGFYRFGTSALSDIKERNNEKDIQTALLGLAITVTTIAWADTEKAGNEKLSADLNPQSSVSEYATKNFPVSSVAVDPVTNATYTSYYDIFTVGAGELNIAGRRERPYVSGRLGEIAGGGLQFGHGAVTLQGIGAANVVWGASSMQGCNVVWGANVVWGVSATDASESSTLAITGEQ